MFTSFWKARCLVPTSPFSLCKLDLFYVPRPTPEAENRPRNRYWYLVLTTRTAGLQVNLKPAPGFIWTQSAASLLLPALVHRFALPCGCGAQPRGDSSCHPPSAARCRRLHSPRLSPPPWPVRCRLPLRWDGGLARSSASAHRGSEGKGRGASAPCVRPLREAGRQARYPSSEVARRVRGPTSVSTASQTPAVLHTGKTYGRAAGETIARFFAP